MQRFTTFFEVRAECEFAIFFYVENSCMFHDPVQPSRHHQNALQEHVNENTEDKYVEIKTDKEMPQTKASKRKHKSTGIFNTEEASKYRSIRVKKQAKMRTEMLNFLNLYHQSTNGNKEYELPKYITKAQVDLAPAKNKSDEDDEDLETFGGEDL